jgi:hypothetical protein
VSDPGSLLLPSRTKHGQNHGPGWGSDGKTEEDWLDMRSAIREPQFLFFLYELPPNSANHNIGKKDYYPVSIIIKERSEPKKQIPTRDIQNGEHNETPGQH